ncbi:NMCC_0638 family (lipo)protein [Massilia sp. BKSP1R2A-1]|uniref:NMCC_0638 family (lipo)protein n=1 Tax=Massilia sp. BKSP1R2A-1 TaxID=3422595 RepID=UPI003D3259ED
MRKIVGALLFGVAPLVFCAPLKPAESAAVQVVDQFVQGCFMSFPYPEKFAEWLAQPGFQKLSGTEASQYLAGNYGNAWNVQLDKSRFVLTSVGASTCNVFANDLDEAMTKNLVVGFLDYLKTQGATYQAKNVTPDGAASVLSSTSYSVSMDGQVIVNLVVTVAPQGGGKFQIALSASKAGA